MQGCSTVEFFVSFICVDELISLFSFSAISDKSDRNTKILKARLALHACEITSRLCSGSHTSIYKSKANFLLKALLGTDVGVYDTTFFYLTTSSLSPADEEDITECM